MHITENHTYEGGYISLPIPMPGDLPAIITLKGNVYHLKNEFHISLVCVKKLVPVIRDLETSIAKEKIIHLFMEYVKNHPLNLYNLTGEIRLATKDTRQTLIAMTRVEGLSGLFKFINERLGTDFATQPAHITLYTLQPNKGIGILDSNELKTMTAIVDVPELVKALR